MRAGLHPLALCLLVGCYESDGEPQISQTFEQAAGDGVDVLVIMDFSGSMEPVPHVGPAVAAGLLGPFQDYEIDVQVGAVSIGKPLRGDYELCTEDDLDLMPPPGELIDGVILDGLDPDSADTLTDLLDHPLCGDGWERGLDMALLATSEDKLADANAGLLRDDAALSILMVSDEDDKSVPATYLGARDLIALKGDRPEDGLRINALTITDEDDCSSEHLGGSATAGLRYVDLAGYTGGVVGNLCAEDLETEVETLALANTWLRDTFVLDEAPDADSILVSIDGVQGPCEPGSWRYEQVELDGVDLPAIVFPVDQLPPPGSEIEVLYSPGDGAPTATCDEDGP